MFCEKCGAQLPDDAKFCEKCGSSTTPGAAPAAATVAAAAAVAPAAPSAFSLALKKFFSNKRNVIITAVALLLVIAVIVVAVIIASQPEKIYIDDYFHVEFEGVDGSGYAYLSSNEKENKAFVKLNEKLFGDDYKEGKESIQKYISISIDMTEEERHSLKNGDKIKIKLEIKDELYEKIGDYKLVLRSKTVKVKGLYKSTQLNVLDYITPAFSGYSGFGVARSNGTLVFPLINGVEARVEHDGSSARIEFYDAKNDSYISSAYAYFDKYDRLSNGDKVTLSFNASDYDTSGLFNGYGIILSNQSRTYTVSGLSEPLTCDITEHVKFSFAGLSSVGRMTITLPEDPVKAGNISVIFREPYNGSEMTNEFVLAIIDENGNNVETFSYYADMYYDLKNGDKVKFNAYGDVEDILTDYGVAFPYSFEVEVKGLEEPFNADPVSRGTYSFGGYENYGTFNFDLPEANRVYKSDDGKYTIKLSFVKNNYYMITVVVADENGRNFLSFNYECYPGTYLKNGDTVEFYCTEWDSNLKGYVTSYGLYFPDRITYTVEGLKEITTVNPLENNITFSFAQDGDYIKMTLGLKEKTVTVGENTLHYSLETYTSWGYKYTKVKITVKDKDGKQVASGYYQFQSDHLYAGNWIYPSTYIDTDPIVRGTGLLFNTDNFYVIVSAQ